MKRGTFLIATLAIALAAQAQVGTTLKEGAKATSEKVQEVGDEAKAAVSSESAKSLDKAKARAHHAKAHDHAKKAAAAAKEIPK
ncbi:MAG TPA: hypothetical protein VGV09_18450 [Steroidobacteraceae bacterium]|nr:hypothetical protein [Steroidobacteraceae bacterium]